MTDALKPQPAPIEASSGAIPPTPEECRAAIDRVLGSKTFRSSEGQKAFLRYVSDRAIEGSAHLIKEYSLGVEVFERGNEFDPRLDPIVRVMARKLRAGLTRYYAAEGANDPVAVELRKGSYVPLFVRMQLPLPALADAREDEPVPQSVQPAPQAIRPALPREPRWVAAAGLAVALASGALFYASRVSSHGASANYTPSIAVLPLTAAAGEDETLADGLTEGLIESLHRVPGLKVAGQASVFQFKNKPPNPRDAGDQLQVHTLLEGILRRSGDRIHLTVQLLNTSNSYKLWSESYDRPAAELPALEREVSRSILNAIGVPPKEQSKHAVEPLTGEAAPRPGAYEEYRKGRHLWSRMSAASLKTAAAHFERAIAIDASYAPAHAGLAYCYALIPQLTDARTPEMRARIRAAANKALALDSTLGEARIALAMAAAYEHDWPTAEREYRIGLALSPGNPIAHLWFGGYLMLLGRTDEALIQRRMAAQLDPLSLYARDALGRTYYHSRRFDDAIREFRAVLKMDPNFGMARQNLARVYLQKGMHREAIEEVQAATRLLGPTPRREALLAYAYAVSGRNAEARRTLNRFLESAKAGAFSAVVIAEVYIGLGQRDEALRWLDKVVAQKDIFTQNDPLYDPLRSDPRFALLLKRMNL